LLDPSVVVPQPLLGELREILPVLCKKLFELFEESLEFRRVEPRRLLRALLGCLQQLLDAAEVEIEEFVEYRNVDRPFDHRGAKTALQGLAAEETEDAHRGERVEVLRDRYTHAILAKQVRELDQAFVHADLLPFDPSAPSLPAKRAIAAMS